MKSNEIRRKFLDFFAARGHTIVAGDLLVPANDPSVLFTPAGMNQFKEQFLGNTGGMRRAASCQKCLRTADLENVGRSPVHHTFFEMLGNFSFGDYFKEEAISWAWELVTRTFALPQERLWVSVHTGDAQAREIWRDKINVPEHKITALGDADNFWPANAPQNGPNGPCGPCSEIFYDWGEDAGCGKKNCSPACSCGRFAEIWNLVFTQYDRQSKGTLAPLPSKNIDTGMGLERIAAVLQETRENYGTDLFRPILQSIEENLRREETAPPREWFNVQAKAVADHIRAAVMVIADGVVPSNETRGYVVRKLIRRSIIYLKSAGVRRPFCYKLPFVVGTVMEEPYPEVLRRHETISGIIRQEEEMFWTILDERASQNELEFKKYAENPRAAVSTAAIAFNQYDTYGVPLEISRENAQKYGLEISDAEFEKIMEKQRERSRRKTHLSGEIFAASNLGLIRGLKSEFTGYEKLEETSRILALIKGKAPVNEVQTGDAAEVVLERTPFYAESGGQAADRGVLEKDGMVVGYVEDAQKAEEAVLHKVKITGGALAKGDMITARVDGQRRLAAARNHTAAHLLQYALRRLLGPHVEQSGSCVSADKLRFDFTHLSALKKETLQSAEDVVNGMILSDYPVDISTMDIGEAVKKGALAFFQEKYAKNVRVISIGEYSHELCGGTHVTRTGEIGLFKIITESAAAQGIRRIEAVTGTEAMALFRRQEALLEELSEQLKAAPAALPGAAAKLIEDLKAREKQLQKSAENDALSEAARLVDEARQIARTSVVIAELKEYPVEALRKICDAVREKKDPVICILMSGGQAKPLLLAGVSKTLVSRGIDAVKIIRRLAALYGGSGGGKKDLAQAGAKDSESARTALAQAPQIIEQILTGGD